MYSTWRSWGASASSFVNLIFSSLELVQRLGFGHVQAALLGATLVESGVAPPLRNNSLIGKAASACLMNPMNCSSIYLHFYFSVILQVDGLRCHFADTTAKKHISYMVTTRENEGTN
jgi:hypothetical protein